LKGFLDFVLLLLLQGAYFLGKALWDKGHGEMMELLAAHEAKHSQVCCNLLVCYGIAQHAWWVLDKIQDCTCLDGQR
jgi:hypothetical protein